MVWGVLFQTCRRGIARAARCSSPTSTQRGSWLCQRRGAVGSPVKKKSRKPFCDFLLCNVVVRRWGIQFETSTLQTGIHLLPERIFCAFGYSSKHIMYFIVCSFFYQVGLFEILIYLPVDNPIHHILHLMLKTE